MLAWAIFSVALLLTACEKDPIFNTYSIDENGNWTHPEENANIIPEAVSDSEGNVYDAVRLGDQVWMAQNLKAMRLNGSYVVEHAIPSMRLSDYDRQYDDAYGYLYKWTSVISDASSDLQQSSEAKEICPDGWHLPSEVEWDEMLSFVIQQPEYQCAVGENAIAKALSSTGNWTECNVFGAPGCTPVCNNATGFNAIPVGDFLGIESRHFGEFASFWTADEYDSDNAYCVSINYNEATVSRSVKSKDSYLAVRCIRD